MPSAPSIGFEIRSSRTLAAVAAAMLLGGLVAVWLADFARWAQFSVSLAAATAGTATLRRYAKTRFVRASGQGGDWTLFDAAGNSYAATLRGHRRIGAFVQVEFDMDASRFTHLLTSDNSDADTRRRLLLVLAHGSPTTPGQPST